MYIMTHHTFNIQLKELLNFTNTLVDCPHPLQKKLYLDVCFPVLFYK